MSNLFVFIVLCAATLVDGRLTASNSSHWTYVWNGCPGRQEFLAAAVGGNIYVMGGRGDGAFNDHRKDVGIFDPTASRATTWSSGPDMPTPRARHGAAAVGDKIFVMGGSTNGGFSNSMAVYDTSKPMGWQSWSNGPPMSERRIDFPAVAVDTKVYAIAGRNDDNISTILGRMEILDTVTYQWSLGPSMSTARYGCAAAAVDGKIYVMGGTTRAADGTESKLTSVEVYDTATQRWSTVQDMPVPMSGQVAVAVDGKIYAMGGDGPAYGDWKDVTVFDAATNKWSMGPSMDVGRIYFGATSLEKKLYSMGGMDKAMGDMEVLDTTA